MSVLQTWYASRCTLAPLGAGLYNIYILHYVCFTDMVRFAMHTRSARRWFVQYLYIALCLFYRHGTLRDAHSLRSALVCTISIYCTMSVLQTWYASRCTSVTWILPSHCTRNFSTEYRCPSSLFAPSPKAVNSLSDITSSQYPPVRKRRSFLTCCPVFR